MPLRQFRSALIGTLFLVFALPSIADDLPEPTGKPWQPVQIAPFQAEVLQVLTTEQGLPANDVTSVVVTGDDRVYAGTPAGLARFKEGKWSLALKAADPIRALAADGNAVLFAQQNGLYRLDPATNSVTTVATLPATDAAQALVIAAQGGQIAIGSAEGISLVTSGQSQLDSSFAEISGEGKAVRGLAFSPDGRLLVASLGGLFEKAPSGEWSRLLPHDDKYSWAPRDVRGVAFGRDGTLWFCCTQGVGSRIGDKWTLYTGHEGLPYNDFTSIAAGEPGVIWFGTKIGAIRYNGKNWNYRRSRRWVPDDDIRALAVQSNGNAWFATSQGAGLLERIPMTLAEKAKIFEDEIDKYHRRTPYGYVLGVSVAEPGKKVGIKQHDSDNDGLWTSMYGAGECFAYAATKDPLAKKRANDAFKAVAFLSEVPQGSPHAPPPGFPARSILPVSGHNPNDHDNEANDRRKQKGDPFWKILTPRWPLSADGQWYWKTDTSSDELDGHYFLYTCYYDFAAETPEEKQYVKDVVKRITDHLIEHDYQLVDHDGKPTRWGRFNREVLEHGHMIAARPLNCLSILSYLRAAHHVTGDQKYLDHYHKLIKEQGYAANMFIPKWALGYGTGNQSDDEMAFMNYYNLIRYEDDPELLRIYYYSLSWYFSLERTERNPLFNFIFASLWKGTNGYPTREIPQWSLEDGADTLVRYPLDRFNWDVKNSHRIDIVPLKEMWWKNSGHLVDGKVTPIDERFVGHWNHNPWRFDEGGNGRDLADANSYLLPYYMGLYYGFIKE